MKEQLTSEGILKEESINNMIIIERCEKKPGIFVGARTYRLILNSEGLYILEMGKAMGYREERNTIANSISAKILDKIQQNRETQFAAKEKELSSMALNPLIDNKKYFLIKKNNVSAVTLTNLNGVLKLSIKSAILKITLHFGPEYKEKVEKVYEYLK